MKMCVLTTAGAVEMSIHIEPDEVQAALLEWARKQYPQIPEDAILRLRDLWKGQGQWWAEILAIE